MSVPECVIRSFLPEAREFAARPLGSGLIHQTMAVDSEHGVFVFQSLNDNVFPDLEKVMENIRVVTGLLERHQVPTLKFLPSQDGSLLARDEERRAWRCSVLMPDTVTYDVPPSPAHLRNAASAFAHFGRQLSRAGEVPLHATIENFHHTPDRFARMEAAWQKASESRQSVADYFALRHAGSGFPEFGLDGLLAPHVPQAVAHNDTKLNNCLFRSGSEEVVCIIDLDTVMRGSWLMDFGDLCRTSVCQAPEDTDDLDSIEIDLDRFSALVDGYAEALGPTITSAERDRMVYSVYLLTYELALRFFTDYLQQDCYFSTDYPEHNLVRTRAQLTLALQVIRRRQEMEEIVKRAFRS